MKDKDCVYPFGIDTAIYLSKEEQTLINSLKIKMALIFGFFHMMLGTITKGFNTIYFN
jgi:V-type H+-transporting ATPase subunit a